ncbi:thioredoxin-disulfide reductase [Emergencia timonensis]|uniref:Thioredoxin reductase n=1 Tax=Emergencia timonensis TaxID=1776384 RepID=A0A415E4L4_9FIRM|nr:thioredoxin-disulfide reductase [Emergencia timonensis]MBS6178883.1 thioredoxin-disulfide reductase [Clostridiales bacterium]MCB6476286.1 thioredoxin-disulfide reductase [Emergencia timonensis]RHJ88561.1 thioredoxin-disulfide reductase [Emergencia timonensis]BDF08154.1 thioredoxin reductase [Emergencia timonensis]BDF12243.1 thioredoxin reductase [Emergencia timonensis]
MYDIVIIGAGPAGLSAAIYGQRAGKETLLIDAKGFGGQIINTPDVENYPGIKKVSGLELATNLYEQATELGAEIVYEKAVGIEDAGQHKKVKTESAVYETKSVIISTGAKNRPMGLEQEEKYTGAGVSYCATCDGAFFRGRDVAVIGGGNTALEDAEVLSGIADKVYLVHRRDQFRGEEANVKRLREKENVEFILDSVPVELVGDTMISGLKVKNVKTEETITLLVQGVFVAIGQMPDNQDFADVARLDDKGYVTAGEDCLTGTPGIFTAGDCRTKKVRQLATAAADGAVAALAAVEYINNIN